MVHILYAPQPVAKQLTAKVAMVHLGDHFDAFLNANNISSWAQDESYLLRDDNVADVLILLGTTKGMTVGQLKYQGRLGASLGKCWHMEWWLTAWDMKPMSSHYPAGQWTITSITCGLGEWSRGLCFSMRQG
ncbi:hypothetical protein I8746_10555 [Pseudomonas sp. USTB-Z]|uniref:hypothetical protein n=1 Tax=Pseudomonas sp. USTB-Z TaxID=2794351 RepID=UPI001C83A59F|nr:hypothetical protein [Pseudomonas sp. USTB-Z]MBX6690043.1 hypothetical protein [Pseudomonas sp. USTB-Z]